MIRRIFLVISLLIVVASTFAQSTKVIAHDPVAIFANGKYYVFTTGPGITAWQSDDLYNWRSVPDVFPEIPDWFSREVPNFNGHLWAPDVIYYKGEYYLYYSVSSFGSNLSLIGVATNKNLDPTSEDFGWTDHGTIIKSIPGRDNWNAIDPNIIFDNDSTPWMAFGSFWGGLKIVKLNDDLISLAEPQEWHTIARRKRDFILPDSEAGDGAIEGPFIFRKGEWYYLFVSFDYCCRQERSTYHVRVGRSKNVLGPYIDKDGIPMLQGGGSLVIEGDGINYYAIGHNSVYTFNGKDYMFSHGYDVNDRSLPKLLIHNVGWDDEGWPVLTEWKKEY